MLNHVKPLNNGLVVALLVNATVQLRPAMAKKCQNDSKQTSVTSIDLAKASPFTQALVVRHVNHLSMPKLNQRSIE